MPRPAPITDPRPLGAAEAIRDDDGAITGWRRLDQRSPFPVLAFLPHLKALDAESPGTAGPPAYADGSFEAFRFS